MSKKRQVVLYSMLSAGVMTMPAILVKDVANSKVDIGEIEIDEETAELGEEYTTPIDYEVEKTMDMAINAFPETVINNITIVIEDTLINYMYENGYNFGRLVMVDNQPYYVEVSTAVGEDSKDYIYRYETTVAHELKNNRKLYDFTKNMAIISRFKAGDKTISIQEARESFRIIAAIGEVDISVATKFATMSKDHHKMIEAILDHFRPVYQEMIDVKSTQQVNVRFRGEERIDKSKIDEERVTNYLKSKSYIGIERHMNNLVGERER